MSNKPENLEEDKQDGNSYQANPSSSTGIPLQGQDNTPQPQNPHCSVASQTRLVLATRTLAREPNRSAPPVDNRARGWMGRSPILLPRTGAEVSTSFPPLQSNTMPSYQPFSLLQMVNAHSRVRPEYTHVHRQPTGYQAAPRELENNVIILRDNRQVNEGLSLNSPRPKVHDGNTDNIPTVISSGFSTYMLEDNEGREGSSYRFKRVSCKKRTMNGIAPSGWLALSKNSGAITPSRGSSRNIRQRSMEGNTELLQLLPENHRNTGFSPFSSQLPVNTYYPDTHFRSPMVPPQIPHQVNVSPLANTYMNPRSGVSYLTSRGGDRSSTPRSGLNNHQWIFNSNPMRNPAVQLPQGNPRNQHVPHQNHSLSVDHNNLLISESSNSSPGVAFREPRERSSNQALVSIQRRSVGIVIREPGSSPLSSSPSSSAGAGRDIPKAASSSVDVVSTQQRSGKEVVPRTDSQILDVISEESSEEEFIYEEYDDDESSEDESEDLDFDANDMSFEDFLEFEEEKRGPTSGLNPDDIEKLIKRAKYEPAEASVPQKQKSCPICWEDYVDEDDIGKLQCEHGYHLQCLKKWLEMKNNCPVCEKTTLMDE